MRTKINYRIIKVEDTSQTRISGWDLHLESASTQP